MSTVTIRTKTAEGDGISDKVEFKPQSAPITDGNDLILGKVVEATTDSAGLGSVVLAPGNYTVQFYRHNEKLTITVPDDDLTYELVALIV